MKQQLERVLRELRLQQNILTLHPEGEEVMFAGTSANVWCHAKNRRSTKFVSSTGQPVAKGGYRPPVSCSSYYDEQDWTTSQSSGWAVVLGAVTDGDARVFSVIFSLHVWGKTPDVQAIERVLYEHLFYTGATRELVSLDSDEKKVGWISAHLTQGTYPWEVKVAGIGHLIQVGWYNQPTVSRPGWQGAENSYGSNPLPWIPEVLEKHLKMEGGESILPTQAQAWVKKIKAGNGFDGWEKIWAYTPRFSYPVWKDWVEK